MLGRGGLRKELTTTFHSEGSIPRPQRKLWERYGRLEDMVMISERDAEVDDRAVPGDRKGDSILGKNTASAIRTLTECNTAFTMLLHLPGRHTAATNRDGVVAKISTLPEQLRRSLVFTKAARLPTISKYASTWASRCSSSILPARGSAAPTRTPMDCCARSSPIPPTCRPTGFWTCNALKTTSLTEPAPFSATANPA